MCTSEDAMIIIHVIVVVIICVYEDWGPRFEPSSVKLSYALSQALLSFVTLC